MNFVAALTKELGKLYNDEFDKYMIAKCELISYVSDLYKYDKENLIFKSELLRNSLKIKVCESKILLDDLKIVSLKVTLLKSKIKDINYIDNKSIDINTNNIRDEYIKVTKKEIEVFCNSTGDFNSIHRKNNAIIPGLLILKSIINYFEDSYRNFISLNIRFLEAIHENEAFNISLEENKVLLKDINNNIFVRGAFIYD